MNLSRLLVLAAVFSGLFSVSVHAADETNFLCRSSKDFSGGEFVEAKVSLRKDWPSLTVVTFLGEGATEMEDFPPAKMDISVRSSGAVAKGYASGLSPLAKIEIDFTRHQTKVIESALLSGADLELSSTVYPAVLKVKRGFIEGADVSMDCAAIL